jgi:hypothetical protein
LGHAAECEPALHNGKSGIRSRRKPLRDNDVSEFHDRIGGGSEHCQLGAPSLWHAALFDWLSSKFAASG